VAVSGGLVVSRRVLIDALAARYGGTAAATVQVARHLAVSPEVSTMAVVARSGSIVERGLAHEEAVRCVALPATRRFELIQRLWWEAFRLPSLVRREQFDVIISMSGMLPRSPGCRLICLIGNPVMYECATRTNALRQWAVRRTAREAECLAAPSRHMAEMVSASVERPCAVLSWGVDHSNFSPAGSPGDEILCVADFKAYKRHDLVLEAWLRLRAPRPILRFVGNPNVDRQAHARLMTQIRMLPEADSIRMEYSVPHERMPDIYRRARLFVMPSEHESFCMPLAEAMACGIPAVVRDIASLRETGGTGAIYLQSNQPERWAATIQRIMDDVAEHARASTLALDAASRFSWGAVAAQLAARM
jgi:glycosyltransferase involved in cell wall biosynthesis